MKNRLFYLLASLTIFAVAILVVANPVAAATVVGAIGTGGFLMATNLSGTVTFDDTDTALAAHKQRDISTIVTEIKPDDYSLDTMIRTIRKEEMAINPKVEYEEVTIREAFSQVNGAFTAAGDATDEHANITVDDGTVFEVDDVVRLEGITNAGGDEIVCIVLSKATNVLELTAVNGDTGQRVPSVADNTNVYRLGNAKSEKDASTTQRWLLPAQDYNYTQNYQCELSQTVIESKTRAYSGFNQDNKRRLELYQFRSDFEANQIFGVRSKSQDVLNSNEIKYTSDGIASKLSLSIDFGSGGGSVDPSVANINSMMRQVFSSNAGSYERTLFAGDQLVEGLSNISSYTREIGSMEYKLVHGVHVTQLQSAFGILNIVHSKTLTRQGWGDRGIVVDLDHVHKKSLVPMETTRLKKDEAGLERVTNAFRVDESSCLTIRYAGTGTQSVHAIWKPAA